MASTTGTSGYINAVQKMDKTTSADGTIFDAIHQQLLNNDAFLNSEIMGMIQKAVNSGVLAYSPPINANGGSLPIGGIGYGGGLSANQVDMRIMDVLINGYKIYVSNEYGGVSGLIRQTLDPPPTTNVTPSLPGSARDDLVFLEMWLDATTGAPKWRIRVVDGVDFGTYPEGLSATSVYAQGGNASATAKTFTRSTTDTGLYTSGSGSTADQTTSATLDGYVYAIPLFRVRRRNNAGFDPDNNPMGANAYVSIVDKSSALSIASGASGSLVFNNTDLPSNTWYAGDYIQNTNNNQYAKIIAISVGATQTTVTVTNMGTTNIVNAWTWNSVSERPDGLYSNIIDATDIVDLRHQVSLTGFNYQALLEKNLDLLLRGQLTTNQAVRYGRDYIGLNMGSYTDDANTLLRVTYDGATQNGTANGATVTPATTGTANFVNGVQGIALSGNASGGANATYTLPTPIALNSSWTMEFLFKDTVAIGSATQTPILLQDANGNTLVQFYLSYQDFRLFVGFPTATYQPNTYWTSCTQSNVLTQNDWHYVQITYNGTTCTITLDGQTQVGNSASPSNAVTLPSTNIAKVMVQTANLNIDSVRFSNIVRTGTPLPSTFNFSKGDRILDGANSDFNMWSDDVGGTAGVNGRTNPYGLSRVPNQVAARVAYNGQEIRHYYGNGVTAGWSSPSLAGAPTGSIDNSGEYLAVTSNETADGARTTFTFNQPSNANGLFVINNGAFSNIVQVNSAWITPTSATRNNSTGLITVVLASAPTSGQLVQVTFVTTQRHAHFIPSTKGFLIHDWTDDQASGTGSQTVFQTTKYNVTSVNHVRVGGAIQNGGYSTSGLNAQSTLSAGAALNATTITVASGSNFVANQNIRIANGDGTWYTTTVTSVSGNTITVPALTKALNQNATVQGTALVTFTTAPVAGTNNIDIVYESILTPQLGDYLRVMYQHTPYQGLLGTPNAGSGKYQFLFVDEDAGFITTIGSGSNSTPNVPAWMKDYPVPSSQLPINGYDYQLKHDTISLSNNTVTGISQQFLDNEQIYEVNASNAANIYSPLAVATPSTQANRGYSTSAVNDGASRQLVVALRDLSSAVPHLVGVALLAQDTSTGELLLLVATMLRTDATNKLQIDGTNGAAIDVFKVQGRPLTKAYGGVAA